MTLCLIVLDTKADDLSTTPGPVSGENSILQAVL